MNYQIRFAQEKDIPQVVLLCQAHAIYEQSEYDITGKKDKLLAGLFTQSPKLFCLVAEYEGKLIGYTTYMPQYSTWDVSEYIYMDCLYLDDAYRGFGVGEKLMRQIQAEAKKLGCSLIQWQTPDFNTRAIKFYKRIGATSKVKERFFLDCE